MKKLYNIDGIISQNSSSQSDYNIKSICRIGRKTEGIENQIEIAEENTTYISRRHATIEINSCDKRYLIKDGQYYESEKAWIESKNGVFLNGRKITSEGIEIKPGDFIIMGDTVLKVIAEKLNS